MEMPQWHGDKEAIDECTREWNIMIDAVKEYIRTTKDRRGLASILEDFNKWAKAQGRDASITIAWALAHLEDFDQEKTNKNRQG